MISKYPVLAATLMAAMALPMAAAPAFAQDQQAVRDALNRAQSNAGQRAVEDLINRLRGAPAQAAPTQAIPNPALPPGSPNVATPEPSPAALPTPPAVTTGTAPASASSPATVVSAAPGSGAPAGSPSGGAAPAVSAAPAGKLIRGGDLMAKAPEIAEKMGLPTADIEVFFGFNSADVTPEAMSTLVVMGQALADPRLAGQRFIIGGHSDGKGRPALNLGLSKRRADAVRKFIIEHYQIAPNRLIARGYGQSQLKNTGMPLADENRRVQIINWTRMSTARLSR